MSANLRRYRAIRDALRQWYPSAPHGPVARHLTPLAALISGIVARKSTQRPTIAPQVPEGIKPESRVKRFTRWVGNNRLTEAVYFFPYAAVLLAPLAWQTLVLVSDGSVVGRGCIALMLHVVYNGRALPLCWRVRPGKKGHFPEERHLALVEQVQALRPPGAQGVLLGDGEFDGIALQQTLEDMSWSSVCRTGMNMTAGWDGDTFRLDTLGAWLKPGTLIELKEGLFPGEAYGPIRLLCCWAKGYKDPLYLITNMKAAAHAWRLYEKRFRIETFFSDQKSRGCQGHKSHIAEPERLSRLWMAACLADIWIIYLGSIWVQEGWGGIIHRRDRCDLSLFQLGLRLLAYFLNEELPIPVEFYVTI